MKKILLILGILIALNALSSETVTTVFSDNFSYAMSSWVTSGAMPSSSPFSVTRSGDDWGARFSGTQLELTNDVGGTANVNGWVFVSTNMTSFASPYNTILSSNSGMVTWTFNIRQIRPDPSGYASGSYSAAYILAGSSTTAFNSGTGYAIVYGQSLSTDPIRLARYSGGLSSGLTNIITSNTTGLTDFGAEYISCKVTYIPSTNTWELFLRNDGASAFTDPETGSLTSQGTVVDNTYTGSSLQYMGCYWQGSTSGSQTAFFDNLKVTVTTTEAAALTVLPTSLNFNKVVINNQSAEQSFAISGNYLTPTSGDITITPPTGYQVSTTSGSGYSASAITFAYTGGTITNKNIYTVFTPTAVQAYSGNIACSGGGATTQNVAVSGNGIDKPTVTTPTSASITNATATLGGNITNFNGDNATERGIYWSLTDGFANGTGTKVYTTGTYSTTGAFTINVSGLPSSSTIYFKAFATNTAGTGYSTQGSFITLAPTPLITVSTTTLTGFTYVLGAGPSSEKTFTISGADLTANINISAPTDYQISNSSGSGFSSSIELSHNSGVVNQTTIYVRLKAGLAIGTYNSEIITASSTGATDKTVTCSGSVTTPPPAANIVLRPSQIDISSISAESAVLVHVQNYTSNVAKYRLYNGSNQYNCWDGTTYVSSGNYSDGPNIPGSPTTSSTWWIPFQRGSNNSTVASYRDRLDPYSTNYQTVALPTATSITNPISITNAQVTFSTWDDFDAKYIILGFDATSAGTLISATSSALTTGIFNLKIENGTTIRRIEVRDLLNNLIESITGTWPSEPTVSTAPITSIGTTTASSGGNVTSDGCYSVTSYGVCWNTTGSPTITDPHTNDGTGTGSFSSSLTDLSPNTTYYVRAYAINNLGTAYGNEVSFTTSPIAASVTTQSVTTIAITSATASGNITSLGVPNPTQYGHCWSTSQNPTIALSTKTEKGAASATGAFTSFLTELTPNTLYYVRAYVTNAAGTVYGEQVSFTTKPAVPTAPVDVPTVLDPIADNLPSITVPITVTSNVEITFTEPPASQIEEVVASLPNFNNLTSTVITAANGTGLATFTIEITTPGSWYGLVYNGGMWLNASPYFLIVPPDGVFTFNVDFGAKGEVIILLGEGESPTLPVEMTSFTATLTAQHYVRINWITQSETNVMGYYIFRNNVENLATATQINDLIPAGNSSQVQSYSYLDNEVESGTTYYYWLQNVDNNSHVDYHGPISVYVVNGNGNENPPIPTLTALGKVYPNPFSREVTINYSLKSPESVMIDIFNCKGQVVRSYQIIQNKAGFYKLSWDGLDNSGKSVSTGIYYYRMKAGRYSATRKMIMMK